MWVCFTGLLNTEFVFTADIAEIHYTYEYGGGDRSTPIISVEVMSDLSDTELVESKCCDENITNINIENTRDESTGVHFLMKPHAHDIEPKEENDELNLVGRTDLLEYLMRNDGSVVCKMCGEILQSRTHWYRHKYKVHIPQPLNPTPLFQCEQCWVYFKSRKGYIGHLASKHSEVLSDAIPVLSNSQIEVNEKVSSEPQVNEELDPELAIPKSSVPNYQTTSTTSIPKPEETKSITKPVETKNIKKTEQTKRSYRTKDQASQPRPADWEERRLREDKMVIDIIDRVRRECETQTDRGAGPARRGYSRKTTIMRT